MSDPAKLLAELETHAPALAPLARARPALLAELELPLELAQTREHFDAALDGIAGEPLARALRHLRHRTMIRVALREFRRLADVHETSRELADLAGATLDAAVAEARRQSSARFGDILRDGAPMPFTVMGMGKLGGGELNLGSDIDICFFYETDECEGEPQTFFTDVARRTTRLIGDVTEDGFVFRVDLRLRPEGSQGALVGSLLSAERYYEAFGRPWERAAWLRARPVAGDRLLGERLLESLAPFVFPRQVDPSIARRMAEMVRQSRDELSREPEHDVKLGRGGIREAEFFVQTLQLIWGGQRPSLRVPGTLEALQRLEAEGFLRSRERSELEAAWSMLRRVEHRVHMTRAYQTHEIPDSDRFAASLGFPSKDAFRARLDAHRTRVAALFDSLQEDDEGEADRPLLSLIQKLDGNAEVGEEELRAVLEVRDADEALTHLMRWKKRPDLPLGSRRGRALPRLAPALLREVRGTADPDLALRTLTEFLQRGGSAYGRLLLDEAQLRRRFVGLLGASPTMAQGLVGYPESLGGLLSADLPSGNAIADDHADAPRERDALVGFLRPRKRRWTLAIALGWMDGQFDLDDSCRLLCRLADAQVRAALESTRLAGAFAVVALGKLGSDELAFGGDLDLVFLHEGAEHAARAAAHIVRVLGRPDGSGPGYEVDTRLRPSGNQGTLVSTLPGLVRYHARRAEDWERQALVRSRVVASNDAAFAERVEDALATLAFDEGAPALPRLCELRGRLERELGDERPDRYHPKVGFGALVDVEFLAQCTYMAAGPAGPRLRHTNEILTNLEGRGLSADEVAQLRHARAFFREVEHARRFLDPRGDGRVRLNGPRARAMTRLMGMQARDEEGPREVLRHNWERAAELCRGLFEAHLGAVGTTPPWSQP